MENMKISIVLFVTAIFFCLISCNKNSDSQIPITLKIESNQETNLLSSHTEGSYLLSLQDISEISLFVSGGDGNYRIEDMSKKNIEITFEGNIISLKASEIGSAEVLIHDNSNNTTRLNILYLPEESNLITIDTYIEGDDLTDLQKATLKDEIIKSSFTGMKILNSEITHEENTIGGGTMRLYNNRNINTYVDYDFIISPKNEEISEDVRERIDWTQPLQMNLWFLLTNNREITAIYFTSGYIKSKSTDYIFNYIHIDVTEKYKEKYPTLMRAYSIHTKNFNAE